jgi:uncharacterized protein (DUF2225 family)
MNETETKRITFFTKNPTVCPVCETSFFKEDLLSGGGRLIAGNLTDELHRLYEPSKKYGEVYPLIYPVVVCPSCFYAAFNQDFAEMKDPAATQIREDADRRRDSVSLLFKDLNFTEFRGLKEGVASYTLALMCYGLREESLSPTLLRGLCALRAAWLLEDLHAKYPGENYDYLTRMFYRKARFFYLAAVERAQTGEEPLGANVMYGPDLDKNYGFDGFLYIAGLLEYKYGPRKQSELRIKSLESGKRIISKLFGSGKASRSKPSAILEKAKDLYDQMNGEIKELKGEA